MKKPRKNIWKFLKYFLIGFLILIQFLALSTAFFIKTTPGNKQTANLISNFLEKKLDTKVSISKAIISRSSLRIYDLCVYDHKNEQVAYIKETEIDITKLRQTPGKFKIGKIKAVEADFYGRRYENDEFFNFQYIIQRLQTDKDPKKTQKKTIIKEIEVVDSKFRLRRPNRHKNKGLINFDDFSVEHIDANLQNFESKGERIQADVIALKGQDPNGFTIEESNFEFDINKNYLSFLNARFKTTNSVFSGDFRFLFKDIEDFADFIDKVSLSSTIDYSNIYLDELKYFSKKIITDEKSIILSGQVSGPVSNLKSESFKLKFGNYSQYEGEINLKGLPDFKESFIDLKLDGSKISFKDISILLPGILFPSYFYDLGAVSFKGSFTGFYNDFVAYGNMYTRYGRATTDLNFKIPDTAGMPYYSGNLELADFEFGKFARLEKNIGKINVKSTVKGQGLKIKNIKANVDAKATYFEFKGYKYRNIDFKGVMASKIFKGKMKIKDKNVNMNFDGKVDLSNEIPRYNLEAQLKNTNFQKLNFVQDSLIVEGILNADLEGKTLDGLKGKIAVLNAKLQTKDNTYTASTLVLNSRLDSNKRNIVLNSELADASLTGQFNISTLPLLFKQTFASFIDSSLIKPDKKIIRRQKIDFDVHLKSTSFLNKMIPASIVFNDNTTIKGYIDQNSNTVKLSSKIPEFNFKNFRIDNLIINANNDNEKLVIYSSFDKCYQNDTLLLDNLNLSANASRDSVEFDLYLHNETYRNHAYLRGSLDANKDSALLTFTNSEIITSDDSKWKLKSKRINITYSPEIRIPYLEISNEENSLKLFGTIGKKDEDPLRVVLDNIDIGLILDYLPIKLDQFSGMLNGQLVLYDVLDNMHFDAALIANPLNFEEQDSIGILTLYSNHEISTSNTRIQGSFYNYSLDNLAKLEGYIDFIKKKELDLQLNIPYANASDFQPFLSTLASNVEGHISSNLHLKGPLKDYSISGEVDISKASFVLDYLKTRYSFSHKIKLDEKGIYINNLKLNDDFGHSGTLNGAIAHDRFKDFYFNLHLFANNLKGLSTSFNDNSVYFGDAFATGKVDIVGPLDLLDFDIQLKGEKDSKIDLKAYDDNNFGNYNFIRFVNQHNQFDNFGSRYQTDLSGISLNLDMELTPSTDVEILLDPTVSDVIKGNGRGNLALQIDNHRNVSMFGTYVIEEGSYMLNILDVIKRELIIQQGDASITWRGDPLNADMDITAYYSLKASLYDLIANDQYKGYKVPVKVKIKLTGPMTSPVSKLDFEIVSDNSISSSLANALEVQQQINLIKQDEQELNKQVISLLMLNSFVPPSTGLQGFSFDQSINANMSSLISAQVSSWLSQFTGQFDTKYFNDIKLDVNYTAENENYQRELDILFSTSMFNDWVRLSSSYDVENNNEYVDIPIDFQVDFQVKEDSKTRLKIFNKSDNNPIYQQYTNRFGVGAFYHHSFNKWRNPFVKKED